MITVTASGFSPRQPDLRPVNDTSVKCEFEVCCRRSTKVKGEWTTVFESVTFVAWNEDARYIAENLTKGRELTAVGTQETSSWEVNGETKRRTVYKLVAYDLKRSEPSAGRPSGGSEQRSTGEPAPALRRDAVPRSREPAMSGNPGSVPRGHAASGQVNNSSSETRQKMVY
jgi:single-stranded DNA-binding protein